jgi:hypothetical protein
LSTFYQKSLFRDVNLDLETNTEDMDRLLTTLAYVLPLIDSINSIQALNITQVRHLYNANSEWTMSMLRMARILQILGTQ